MYWLLNVYVPESVSLSTVFLFDKVLLSFTKWSLTLWIRYLFINVSTEYSSMFSHIWYTENDSFAHFYIHWKSNFYVNCSCLMVYSFRNTNLNFEWAWPSIQNIHKWKKNEKNVWKRSKVEFVLCSIFFAVSANLTACVSS